MPTHTHPYKRSIPTFTQNLSISIPTGHRHWASTSDSFDSPWPSILRERVGRVSAPQESPARDPPNSTSTHRGQPSPPKRFVSRVHRPTLTSQVGRALSVSGRSDAAADLATTRLSAASGAEHMISIHVTSAPTYDKARRSIHPPLHTPGVTRKRRQNQTWGPTSLSGVPPHGPHQ